MQQLEVEFESRCHLNLISSDHGSGIRAIIFQKQNIKLENFMKNYMAILYVISIGFSRIFLFLLTSHLCCHGTRRQESLVLFLPTAIIKQKKKLSTHLNWEKKSGQIAKCGVTMVNLTAESDLEKSIEIMYSIVILYTFVHIHKH